jgi:hypothetical protein
MEAWVMARSFNGTSDHIDSSAYTAGTAGTVSIWFNFTTNAGAYATLLGQDNQTVVQVYQQIHLKSSGHLAYYAGTTLAGIGVDPGTAVATSGVWYHACCTYDSTNGLKTYLNGVSDGTAAANGALQTGSNPFMIGYDSNFSPARDFNGSLADAAHWSAALSTSEVVALAAGARPSTIRPLSLLGWWPLGGVQSPEPDLSGNKNNGTLTGTAPAFGPPIMQFTPRWPQFFIPSAPPPIFILMPQIVT